MSGKIEKEKAICLRSKEAALSLIGRICNEGTNGQCATKSELLELIDRVWTDQCGTEESNQRRLAELEESVLLLRQTVARILYREAEAKLPNTIPDL